MKNLKYIIVNPSTPKMGDATAPIGYAFLSLTEGPIFTTLMSAATKFDTLEQAQQVLRDKYNGDSHPILKILPYIELGDATAQGYEQWLAVEETIRSMKQIELALPTHFSTHPRWIAAKKDYEAACRAYLEAA